MHHEWRSGNPTYDDLKYEEDLRGETEEMAKFYTSRPCNVFGERLTWAVLGEHRDGSAGGVLAWCWDKDDADEGLFWLRKTLKYKGLTIQKMLDD